MLSLLFIFTIASASTIKDGYLHDPSLKAPVLLESIERTEFVYFKIDENLAKTPEQLAYVRLRNEEELWIKGQRYAVIRGQKIPITIDQEFEIMTALVRKKSGFNPVIPKNQDEREIKAATESLQIQSTAEANARKVKDIQDKLKKFDEQTFPMSRKMAQTDPKNLPKSLSPFRLIIDNQNIFLDNTNLGDLEYNLATKVLETKASNPIICNMRPTPPATPGSKVHVRVGATSYWSAIGEIDYDPVRKIILTATPNGNAVCADDVIFKSGFEESGVN